jgi:PAS domain-containing protein
MISTHWRRPHRPTERELQPLDVLARQAAYLIERNETEKALRESREQFRWLASIVESSGDGIIGKDVDRFADKRRGRENRWLFKDCSERVSEFERRTIASTFANRFLARCSASRARMEI